MAVPAIFVELCEAQQDKKISNVIGVVIDVLPSTRTRTGSYMVTFTLDDGTLQKGQKCRLFTKSAAELPPINSVGDIVMLRKVRYLMDKALLVSFCGEPAAWAVFHSPIPKDQGIFENGIKHARSKGMAKVTKQEMDYVIALAQTQNSDKFTILSEEVQEKLRTKSKSRQCLIKDLVIDSYCLIIGEVVKVFYIHDRATLYITDYTENNLLYNYGSVQKDDVHDENSSQWPGPPGKYTLIIECWSPHSDWIKTNVQAGNILRIQKVHIRHNKGEQGLIEGRLHTDKIHEDLVLVNKLKKQEVPDLFARKEELGWAVGFAVQEDEEDDRRGKKRKSENIENATSGKNKNARKRIAKESAKMEASAKDAAPVATPRAELQEAIDSINENIRCEQGNYCERTVAEIRAVSRTQNEKSSNGQLAKSESTETVSYAIVRVEDFKPSRIEDFAKAVEISAEDAMEVQEVNSADSDNDSNRSELSILNKSTQIRRTRWEWQFALLLEDASVAADPLMKKNNQLITYVSGSDAEYLLGLRAVNLRTNPRTLAQLREKLFLLWGDREELKQEEAKRKEGKQSRVLADVSTNVNNSKTSSQAAKATSIPFKCLIEEYGELNDRRWQRKFKLKGTTIVQGVSLGKGNDDLSQGLESWDDVVDETVQMTDPQTKSFRAPRAG